MSTDVAATLAAWEWAAELRRLLEALATDRAGDWARFEIARSDGVPPPDRPGDWDALQLSFFDREIEEAAKKPAHIFEAVEVFSGPSTLVERTAGAIAELRCACESDPRWMPMHYRQGRAHARGPLPPNARITVAEAAKLAIDLVRLHFKRPLVDVGLLEDPQATTEDAAKDRREALAVVWEVAPERFAEAVRWCAPTSKVPPSKRLDIAARENRAAMISRELEAAEDALSGRLKKHRNGAEDDGADNGKRGGPEDVAYVLIGALTGTDRNTVRDCFLERHPSWRADLDAHRDFAREYASVAHELSRPPSAADRAAMNTLRRQLLTHGAPGVPHAPGWLRARIALRTNGTGEG